jgi:DNA invertase Pin-like site-specific DNA recombinase
MSKLVAYYRLSKPKRGPDGQPLPDQWGHSLDAQVAAVAAYSEAQGRPVVASYHEVETGTKARTDNRPELVKALAHAKAARATLVIAKLDRLARNVHFISGLLETGVEFVALDIPNADRFMIHVYASVAEQEARRTSDRTKAGLAAAKAKGVLLGGANPRCRNLPPELRAKAALAGGQARRSSADSYYQALAPRVNELRLSGMTQAAIAERFNSEGLTTQSGGPWTQVAVLRVLRRFAH